jgi:hypothetical protein
LRGIGLPVDLDLHHRLRRPMAAVDQQQIAVDVAPHRQHRMGEQVDVELSPVQFVGDRIDQERHVVVDDLYDRVTALEAVLGRRRVEHADLGDARQPPAREGQQGEGGGGPLLGRGGGEILVGDPFVKPAHEGLGFVTAGGGADRLQPIRTCRQRRRHRPVLRSWAAAIVRPGVTN